jgi:hypothetical protein
MTPMTLRSLERGGLGVTIGAYLAVMQVLGIEKDLEHLAQDDPIGRSLQDAQITRTDSSRSSSSDDTTALLGAVAARQAEAIHSLSEWRRASDTATRRAKKARENTNVRSSGDQNKFINSRTLVDFLRDPKPASLKANAKPPASKAKRR